MNSPDKVTAMKINKKFNIYNICTMEIKDLGEKWCQYLLKTGFGRMPLYSQDYNDGEKICMGKSFYIVESNYRRMIYNENNDYDDRKFVYTKEFVEYVLGKCNK